MRLLEGFDIHGTGNALDNTITGNSRNNILDGVTGADTMIGGNGDDTYYVDNTGDQIIELANEGTDTVQSSISTTLSNDLENLVLLDFSKPEHGLVDGEATLIYGYPKRNELDYMQGDAVTDYLGTCALTAIANLLTQADRPTSEASVVQVAIDNQWAITDPNRPAYERGGSNYIGQQSLLDSYGIRNDLITGYNEQGIANLIQSGRGVIVALNAGVLWGDAAYTGNGGVNHVVTVTGAVYSENDGTLMGFYIADSGRHMVSDMTRYVSIEDFRAAANVASAYAIYTLEPLKLWDEDINGTGNALNNTIIGNRGENVLSGGDGNDSLEGGAGNDTLDGGVGADTMMGGVGDDVYVVDVAGDVVTENAKEGTDTVQSTITYTLGTHIENLTLTGFAAINGTGNTLDNTLTGNSASNTLDGGAGNDILDGASGNDILNGGIGDDQYLFNANNGLDQILDSSGNDKIVFGTGITLTQITASRANGEITLTVSTGNSIHFADLGSNIYAIEQFEFADGTLLDASWVTALLNTPPEGADNTITINEDATHTFSVADFGFVDANVGDSLSAVRIESLPVVGNLRLNGVAVTAGQEIVAADIINLVFTTAANANGANYASFTFSVKDQYGAFDTTPNTLSFNVTAVNDAPILTTAKALLANGSEDTPYIITQASLLTGFSDVDGDSLSVNGLTATNGTLSAFNVATQSWTFTPTVNFNGTVNLSYNVTDGIADTAATQSFNMEAVNDGPTGTPAITGNPTRGQVLVADAASIADADGLGAFTYQWQSSGDGISWNNINDATSASYTLGNADVGKTARVTIRYTDNAGNAEYIESAATSAINIQPITGTASNDVITGTADADILDGGTGADLLQGGAGDDLYIVDNAGDIIVEGADGGIDTVQVSVSVQTWQPSSTVYTLGDNIENGIVTAPTEPPPVIVTATGATTTSGSLYGNALDNTLHGAAMLTNYLYGNAGNDSLYGGNRQDMLVGGDGDDFIDGGAGSDNVGYHTANAGVTVNLSITGPQNTMGAGIDTLLNVENILGSSYSDHLIGNAANNRFQSMGGDDVIDGGDGAFDLIEFTNVYAAVNVSMTDWTIQSTNMQRIGTITISNIEGVSGSIYNDTLTGSSGADYLNGYAGSDVIDGGDGDDWLAGGSSADTITGGQGKDTFILASDRGLGIENSVDTITDFNLADDMFQLTSADFKAFIGVTGGLASSNFVAGAGITTASDADDYIIYNSTDGNVFYDADGSGSAYNPVLIADVTDGLALTHSHFKVSDSVFVGV